MFPQCSMFHLEKKKEILKLSYWWMLYITYNIVSTKWLEGIEKRGFTGICIKLLSKGNNGKSRSKEYVESWSQYPGTDQRSKFQKLANTKKMKGFSVCKLWHGREKLLYARTYCANPILFITCSSPFHILNNALEGWTHDSHSWCKNMQRLDDIDWWKTRTLAIQAYGL